MIQSRCKFCGGLVNAGHRSCKECTRHCMTQCTIASSPNTSWHKSPCTECEHNPYNKLKEPQPGRPIPGRK